MTMPTAVSDGRAQHVGPAADDVDSGARPWRRNATQSGRAIAAQSDTAEADGSNGSNGSNGSSLRRTGLHPSHVERPARGRAALVSLHALSGECGEGLTGPIRSSRWQWLAGPWRLPPRQQPDAPFSRATRAATACDDDARQTEAGDGRA